MVYRIHTLSLYVLPNNCTDFKSTAPFNPFLPSLERLLRQHLRIQQKQIPRIITPTPVQKEAEIYNILHVILYVILNIAYNITCNI